MTRSLRNMANGCFEVIFSSVPPFLTVSTTNRMQPYKKRTTIVFNMSCIDQLSICKFQPQHHSNDFNYSGGNFTFVRVSSVSYMDVNVIKCSS